MAAIIDTMPQGLADIISDMEGDSYSVEELVRAADIMASTGEQCRQARAEAWHPAPFPGRAHLAVL